MIDSNDNHERFSAHIELAGDIVAMANSNGGNIVCGLSTEKQEELQTDRVTEVKMFASDSFYTQEEIQEVIRAHIRPHWQKLLEYKNKLMDYSLKLKRV